MLEYETKAMLTPSEYEFLKTRRYYSGKVSLQTNYYYDTEELELNRQNITCRIREKNGICTATIKDHQSNGCSIETSRAASGPEDSSFFEGMGICLQGSLVTVRTTCQLCDGVQVMIDENRYLDTVDYEIEFEYDSNRYPDTHREILELSEDLEYHGVVKSAAEFRARFDKGRNKSGRFFRRKVELTKI